MTISTYHVESVLKAYGRQSKVDGPARPERGISGRYNDVVTLTSSGGNKKEAFEKISYSLLDVLLKNGESS